LRFLLIDKITSFEPGKRGTAIKNISLSEDFFDDHFPEKPIMPGVLMIEGMAQLSGVLLEAGLRDDFGTRKKALLSVVEKAKFRKPVYPGECLEYRAEVVAMNEAGGKVSVCAFSSDAPVGEASLVFSFHEISSPRLEAHRTEIVAFWLRGLKGDERD